MDEEIALILADEAVKTWEERPSLSWDELGEMIKIWVKEIKEGVTYESS